MTAPVLHQPRHAAMDADGTRPRAPQPARETDRSRGRVPGGPRARRFAAGLPGGSRSRRFAAGLLAGVVVAGAIALAVGPGSPTRSGSPAADPAIHADRTALLAYADAIEGPIDEGGAVVVYGMRPGMSDIADGAYADEVLVTMATGWAGEMRRIRGEVAALDVPAFLAPVAALFDDAFAAYVRTAEGMLAAARVGGDERAALLAQAADHGREADQIFDQATEVLARERARLGLATDHEPGGPR